MQTPCTSEVSTWFLFGCCTTIAKLFWCHTTPACTTCKWRSTRHDLALLMCRSPDHSTALQWQSSQRNTRPVWTESNALNANVLHCNHKTHSGVFLKCLTCVETFLKRIHITSSPKIANFKSNLNSGASWSSLTWHVESFPTCFHGTSSPGFRTVKFRRDLYADSFIVLHLKLRASRLSRPKSYTTDAEEQRNVQGLHSWSSATQSTCDTSYQSRCRPA